MKKNSFMEGAIVATLGIVIVKIIGLIYVIPFNAIIGEQGGALYGYGYNIYQLFLSISSAGFPFAISKMTSEYLALGNKRAVIDTYKMARNLIVALSVIVFLVLFIFSTPIAKLIIGSQAGGNSIEDISFVIKVISFAILIVPFLSVTKGFLQGHKYITPTSISQIIEQIVRVAVILVGSYVILNVLKLGLRNAVGISVFAAFIGGVAAYIYLRIKLKKSKLLNEVKEEATVSKKELLKKVITYSVPFILISLIYNLYSTADMILVSRTMNDILHIDGSIVESVVSVFTAWGSKLNNILLAVTVGLTTSLIPNIVSSYTVKNMKDVDNKFNKAIQIVLLLIVPMTLFLSLLSDSVWTLFYGTSTYGPIVYKLFVFYALFGGAYSIVVNVLQGLSKYKLVISGVLLGLLFKLVFNVPMIMLFDKMGLEPSWGAITVGIIGYSLSMIITLVILAKKYKFSFKDTTKKLPGYVVSWIVFASIIIILKQFIPTTLTGRMIQVPILAIFGIVSFGLYLLINYFNGNLTNLFDIKKKMKLKK